MTNTPNTTAPARVNWSEQKAKLKAKYTNLTDSDLQYENGKKDEMLERVQIKLGKTKEELDAVLAAL